MTPRKILAIKLRALGDTVLLTAPLMELRQAYPRAEIHVLIDSRWAPLLENHPAVDKVWSYERRASRTARARSLSRVAWQLRRERFDCAVNFHASPSTATLAFATGARTRSIHFHGHRSRNRFSTVFVPGKGVLKPIIERDMDALRALGLHVPAGRIPSIPLQTWEVDEACRQLNGLNLPRPLLILGLGASRETKTWPLERFAALAVEWCRTESGGVLAVCGPDEGSLSRAFLQAVDEVLPTGVQDTTPEDARSRKLRSRITSDHLLPLRRLAALLGQASVFAGNDSGPRHLAVAVNTPTVTIFGPEDPFERHPYPPSRHALLYVQKLPCRKDADPGMPPWCGLTVCLKEEHRCMRMIGMDQVLAECRRVSRR